MITESPLKTAQKKMIWIIDDDRSIRWVLEKTLKQANFVTRSFDRGDAILYQLQKEQPALIISDIRMPGLDGFGVLKIIKERFPNLPVIIMTAHSNLDSAVTAYKKGAFDYLPKPFDIDEAVSLIQRAIAQTRTEERPPQTSRKPDLKHSAAPPPKPLKQTTPAIRPIPEIIGEAAAMQEVFRTIGRLSRSSMTVLIQGQSGTGKALIAAALHQHSTRRDKPYLTINMAAAPPELLEKELFGVTTQEAQTKQVCPGLFERAQGGTIFLDEIGDMPLNVQTRLLRLLSEKEFYRLGDDTAIRTDVRIITATHRQLLDVVRQGLFREDLYHRLNVIQIQLPPLKERREDIPKLAEHFLKQAAKQQNIDSPKILSEEVYQYLREQAWPGNIRELENLCQWLSAMVTSQTINMEDLPNTMKPSFPSKQPLGKTTSWESALQQWAHQQLSSGKKHLLNSATPLFEKAMIEVALQHSGGRKRDASELLGWGRNTLTRKIKELNLSDFDK